MLPSVFLRSGANVRLDMLRQVVPPDTPVVVVVAVRGGFVGFELAPHTDALRVTWRTTHIEILHVSVGEGFIFTIMLKEPPGEHYSVTVASALVVKTIQHVIGSALKPTLEGSTTGCVLIHW